ncbi:hypothetical protein CTheo_5352 [Ceratobasidium theobromae]|uniref:DRBM domain-containing protein n=1 Tax=Ceratobasidium theobromae TaxID=1582974 RepID=A0A5N5QIT6_9AGAM|nr:hypothetical protein CTheo_5352 [Ceratobasidium theobromae]
MRRKNNFTFTTPTKDRNCLAQLREWADYYHIDLTWEDSSTQRRGTTKWTSYAIIQGHAYNDPEFIGVGEDLSTAHGHAAEALINSPGTLDAARSRALPPIIPPARR